MNKQLKVVYCRIVSWAGCVEGAEHYYVNMEQRGSETITLWHILTESEAARLNRRKVENSRWEAGADVGYFFSRERGVKAAIANYKLAFPGAVILVEGDPITHQPQPILDGPPEAMEVINNLVELAEAINCWEEDEPEMQVIQDEAMQVIQDEWKAIWHPEFEE